MSYVKKLMGKVLFSVGFGMMSINSFAAIEVDNAYVRLLPPVVTNTTAYFTLTNTDDSDVALLSVASPFASSIEIHAHEMKGEMMAMVKQSQVTIAANSAVKFVSGGLHLMMFDMDKTYREKTTIPLMLHFSNGIKITVQANVGKQNKSHAEPEHHHHHH